MIYPTSSAGKMLATADAARRARSHVARLQFAGLSLSAIARSAGIGKGTLSVLMRDARAPMTRSVAAKIVAARPFAR